MRLNQTPRPFSIWLIISVSILLVLPAVGLVGSRSSTAALVSRASSNPEVSTPSVNKPSASTASGLALANLPSTSPLTYHGGPVQHVQYAYVIFWLPPGQHYEPVGNDSRFESLVSRYFTDVSGSNFSGVLVQYPDDINASPTEQVVLGGGYVETAPYPHVGNKTDPLLGSDITNEIENVISTGSLPTGEDDSYYVITGNGIDVCEDSGLTMCTFSTPQQPSGFCAYHSYLGSFSYALLAVSSGCQISISGLSTYPNGDSIADSEISLASQEQFDMQTDPFYTSWYGTSTSVETSDMCAGQFGNVNTTTGANVVLDGNNYLIQEEWSNAAGSCTFTPPPTASVQITLNPSSGSKLLSSDNYFPLSYAIGKQLFVVDYTTYPITIHTDPNTSLTLGPTSSESSNGLEKWCLDYSCSDEVLDLGNGSSTASYDYFDLLEQNVYEATPDNTVPASFNSISYGTAPPEIGSSAISVNTSLTDYNQYVWMLRGTVASVSPENYSTISAPGQQWSNPEENWTISEAFQIPVLLSYHQYSMNFSYSVIPANGPAVTGPNVTYSSDGANITRVALTGPTLVFADAGSYYNYSQSLVSISSTERWVSPVGYGNGKVSAAANVSNSYFYQLAVGVNYNFSNPSESPPSEPQFLGQSFGASFSVWLTNSSNSFWLDYNSSYSVSNPLSGSNSTDRWTSNQTNAGTVSESLSLNFTYYHQFDLNFSYTVLGGGSPVSLPAINYSSFNNTLSLQLSNTPSPVWVNAGSMVNVSSSMTAANSTERWAYLSGSEIVSAPGTFDITLYHQFELGFGVVLKGGGLPESPPTFEGMSFGLPLSIAPNATSADSTQANATSANSTQVIAYYWLDAGSSYSIPASLGSNSSERWLSLSNQTGVVDKAQTIVVDYYNQYLISLGYSVTNGADPSGGPSASVTLFGAPETVVVNQTLGQVWADGGSAVTLPSLLPGSNSGEQWTTNSSISGTVAMYLSLKPTYDHQFYLTLTTNPSTIPVVMSESSGWYDSGSSLVVTLIPGRGWNFEGWSGQGTGAYSGNLSSLLLTVSSPVTETANFYTALSITAPSSGSVTYSYSNFTGTVKGGQTETVYVPPNQVLSMSATPFPVFYEFSGWSGNLTGGPNATKILRNPYTISLSSPSSLSVSFKLNLIGIVIVIVVVIVAIASVFMLRRRNRPQLEELPEEYSEETSLDTIEGETSDITANTR